MITGKEFADKALEHIGLAYKWNGGFNGDEDLVTVTNVDLWAKQDPVHFGYQKQQWLKTYFIGKLAGDCSGLVTHCIGIPKTYSGTLFDMCVDKKQFDATKPLNEQIPQVPGVIVWRDGHIGISRGDGYIVESGSTRYGVTATFINNPQTNNPWTHYGYLKKYIDYGTVTTPVPVSWTCNRVLKLTSPIMKGADVKNLQTALTAQGFNCGTIDGQLGTKTSNAIKAYQTAKGLTVDGIAGKNTITSLGVTWAA